jgi:hypothetical protein
MTPLALLFFAAFALCLVGTYLAIRRGIPRPGLVSAASVIINIILMTLFGASQQDVVWLHALLVGTLLGGGLSVAALAMAWYFHGNDVREQKLKAQMAASGLRQDA